jgi:lipopolysaccharide export system protein LptA
MEKYVFIKVIILYLFLVNPSNVWSQSLNLATGTNNQPIEITADNGIEWQRDNQLMIASGKARATRGKTSVEADTLQAFYNKDKTGTSNLSRIKAIGRVKITSPTQKLTGEVGVYDLTKGVLVITGKKVSLVSGKNIITANKQLEYYEKKAMAVARKNARANHDGKRLKADTLVALFFRDKNGKTQLSRVQAFDNVRVVTNTESIWANKGIYDVSSGIATLDGNIRITRDGNQLNGDSAIINLKTGVSKLLTSSNAQSPSSRKDSGQRKKKRVRGYLRPKRK